MSWPETPGPYGWNASREQRERVEQEITRQRAQRARRRATNQKQENPR
jgi:hypothetical protein